MNILAAARSLPFHSIGGMQSIAWDLLTEFARLGHKVDVLTTSIPGQPQPFERSGVNVVPLSESTPERYTQRWWKDSRDYARVHLLPKVDAVLSVSVAAAGLLPLKRAGMQAPFIFQAHGSSWGEAVSKWKSRNPLQWAKSVRNLYWTVKDATLLPSFDQFVLVGAGLQRQFDQRPTKWLTGAAPKIVIPNGVDTSLFRFDPAARASVRGRLGWQEHERVLVFAARLHAQKGAAEAIRALAELNSRSDRHRLLVIGDGPQQAALAQLAASLRCAREVTFIGAVPRAEMPALLSAGDIFVFPSRRKEGLPMNVLEALAAGLPCVCSDSLREVFDPNLPIDYGPPGDPWQLASALQRALARGASRASLLPPEYSLDLCARRYIDVIERLRRD